MAEYAHQVPEKYGQPTTVYRPRITSFHRRLLAAAGPLLVAAASVAFMFYRRPAMKLSIVLILLVIGALVVAYSVLKPSIVVKTQTHILRGKLIGWQAVGLAQVDRTIVVERLTPKKALNSDAKGVMAVGNKGIPGAWLIDAAGKQLMRLDGRIWDYKTLKSIATSAAPQTISYTKINVVQMDQQHKGLITFNELHPGWRSATIAIVSAVIIVVLGLGAVLPEEILHDWNLLQK